MISTSIEISDDEDSGGQDEVVSNAARQSSVPFRSMQEVKEWLNGVCHRSKKMEVLYADVESLLHVANHNGDRTKYLMPI